MINYKQPSQHQKKVKKKNCHRKKRIKTEMSKNKMRVSKMFLKIK